MHGLSCNAIVRLMAITAHYWAAAPCDAMATPTTHLVEYGQGNSQGGTGVGGDPEFRRIRSKVPDMYRRGLSGRVSGFVV